MTYIFATLAIICIFIFFCVDEGGWFGFLAVVFGTIAIISGIEVSDSPTQNQGTCVVDQNTRVDTCDDNTNNDEPKEDVKQGQNNSSVEQKQEVQKEESKKDFDWQKWADTMTNNSVLISCNPDGIQVYVSGSQDQSDLGAGPSALSIYPRLHKDGTLFTCEETKDPTREVKK